MPLFRCFIRGENFPGRLAGLRKPVGFYVTRFVEASSAEAAEDIALAALKEEPKLRLPVGLAKSAAAARVYFEEIVEVEPSWRQPESGFTFFEMEN